MLDFLNEADFASPSKTDCDALLALNIDFAQLREEVVVAQIGRDCFDMMYSRTFIDSDYAMSSYEIMAVLLHKCDATDDIRTILEGGDAPFDDAQIAELHRWLSEGYKQQEPAQVPEVVLGPNWWGLFSTVFGFIIIVLLLVWVANLSIEVGALRANNNVLQRRLLTPLPKVEEEPSLKGDYVFCDSKAPIATEVFSKFIGSGAESGEQGNSFQIIIQADSKTQKEYMTIVDPNGSTRLPPTLTRNRNALLAEVDKVIETEKVAVKNRQ